MPRTKKKVIKRDAKRDIGEELLQSVREMTADKRGQIHSPVAQARHKAGLSQSKFAELLGVSVRTLQDWEQGRREPSGAARTLIKVAEKQPDILRELAA